MRRFLFPALLLGLLFTGGTGCKPTYPKCDSDTDCPGNKEGKEFCVNGQCQQCRPGQSDCPDGLDCNAGRCEPGAGYCTKNAECKNGAACINHRCVACQNDGQCGTGRCNAGRCEADNRTRCKGNDDCKESEDCVKGFCTPANRTAFVPGNSSGGSCSLDIIYFGFNEYVLNPESTGKIDRNAQCVKQQNRAVNLIGRTDSRGTTEYNLQLAEKRAQAVRERLLRMGIPAGNLSTLPRGELDATGTEESGWSRDRNVELQWR